MALTPRQILFFITVAIIAADVVWASLVPFDIDRRAYLYIGLIAVGIGFGSLFYAHIREDENLSAMLFGTFFLVSFSAGLSLLNYFLVAIAGPRIDQQFAAIDRMIGINWPSLMQYAEAHPFANRLLFFAYASLLPQVAILINCLGLCSRPNDIYRFCLSLAVGAIVTVAFWTCAPSLGAFTLYDVRGSSQFVLAVDASYAHDLVNLLAHGPGRISPFELKGLIAFPSFHTVLAILVVWYAWPIKWLRWPALVLNGLMLISIPIQGGHHIVDIAGGFAVAALAIGATGQIARWCAKGAASAAGTKPISTVALVPDRGAAV